jgi:hypothetical protein
MGSGRPCRGPPTGSARSSFASASPASCPLTERPNPTETSQHGLAPIPAVTYDGQLSKVGREREERRVALPELVRRSECVASPTPRWGFEPLMEAPQSWSTLKGTLCAFMMMTGCTGRRKGRGPACSGAGPQAPNQAEALRPPHYSCTIESITASPGASRSSESLTYSGRNSLTSYGSSEHLDDGQQKQDRPSRNEA